ncbi:hypothetical protein SAMN05661010_02238 [Modicisalibacter muralis]|uniref:Transposase, IS30 family n=1 Tax=Modicisalibacter muralis TaxID=119000 RepID=A0A1G9LZN0_9GAMM|nr:hypothetical protein SAMN05661010_02238 [Halomonas muralis]
MNPDDPNRRISHESIYNALYVMPRGTLKKELIACLRQGNAKRRPRSRGRDRRRQIPDLVSIHLRPPSVEDRLMPGHWEGELIMGAGNRSRDRPPRRAHHPIGDISPGGRRDSDGGVGGLQR